MEVGTNLGGGWYLSRAGEWYTEETAVPLPPGSLKAGRQYFAYVEAISSVSRQVTSPFRRSLPMAITTAATAIFTP